MPTSPASDRDAGRLFGWNLAGILGAVFLLLALTAAADTSGSPSPHLLDWLGLSGIVSLLGWARQWGQHQEFKQQTQKWQESVNAAFLRTDRWEDHRDELQRQHRELLERIEGLHQSLQAVRRDQLHVINGQPASGL